MHVSGAIVGTRTNGNRKGAVLHEEVGIGCGARALQARGIAQVVQSETLIVRRPVRLDHGPGSINRVEAERPPAAVRGTTSCGAGCRSRRNDAHAKYALCSGLVHAGRQHDSLTAHVCDGERSLVGRICNVHIAPCIVCCRSHGVPNWRHILYETIRIPIAARESWQPVNWDFERRGTTTSRMRKYSRSKRAFSFCEDLLFT
jgi:hypothetical protein